MFLSDIILIQQHRVPAPCRRSGRSRARSAGPAGASGRCRPGRSSSWEPDHSCGLFRHHAAVGHCHGHHELPDAPSPRHPLQDKGHATFRAFAGCVLADFRMHRAGMDGGFNRSSQRFLNGGCPGSTVRPRPGRASNIAKTIRPPDTGAMLPVIGVMKKTGAQ